MAQLSSTASAVFASWRPPGNVHPRRACDASRSTGASPLACEGPRGRALRRAARRRRPRPLGGAFAGAFQPGVPACVRRVAARVPGRAAARACRLAAPLDRQARRVDLLRGRPPQRRLVHDQLQPGLRNDADRLSRIVPPGVAVRADPDLRAARVRAPSETARFEKTAQLRIRSIGRSSILRDERLER